MNNVHSDKRIRVFGTPEDPLFLARDVAEWIDYAYDKEKGYRNVPGKQSIRSRSESDLIQG